jgi:hypothetical protein
MRLCTACSAESVRLAKFDGVYIPRDSHRIDLKYWRDLTAESDVLAELGLAISGWSTQRSPLATEQCESIHAAVANVRSRRSSHDGTHCVYVALLQSVPKDGSLSFYVGMTGKSPEHRYRDHKSGVRSGRGWIKRYGIGLTPELYEWLNPMVYDNAVAIEVELAEAIRASGLVVHQA